MHKMIFFILLLCYTAAYSQPGAYARNPKAQRFIEEVSKLIKRNALYADSINWKELSEETASLALGASDSADYELLVQYFTRKLRQAGDQHSFFLTKKATTYIKKRPQPTAPEAFYLGDGIGMIKVPYCLTMDPSKDRDFANAIRREVRKVDTAHLIAGWIVDLRHNIGGNMWPMLAGLNALIEDGTVGYFVSPASKKVRPWISKNGQINAPIRRIDNYKIRNRQAKIAVLIDSMTASSGEMTAISFVGLPQVCVFGQPSAGLTTGNTTFRLPGGIELNLATTYVADRTKKPYLGKIIPDVIVASHQGAGRDETLEAAKRWLLQGEEK